MQHRLPIRKSKEDIEFYIEYGPKFGSHLYKMYEMLRDGKIKTGVKLNNWYNLNVIEGRIFPREAVPIFETQKNYLGEEFGASICVSIGDAIAHSRPTSTPFKDGDIISVDCGLATSVGRRNLHFDSGFTVKYNQTIQPYWILAPHQALQHIVKIQPKGTWHIAEIIQATAAKYQLETVVMLTGHGIGYKLHEEPHIRNAPGKYADAELFEGLCFCAEPIFVLPGTHYGSPLARIYIDSDGWSIRTGSNEPGSHFETMFCIHNKTLVDITGVTKWLS